MVLQAIQQQPRNQLQIEISLFFLVCDMTTAAHYGNLPVMCKAAAFRPLKRPTIDLIYTSPYFVCLPFFLFIF